MTVIGDLLCAAFGLTKIFIDWSSRICTSALSRVFVSTATITFQRAVPQICADSFTGTFPFLVKFPGTTILCFVGFRSLVYACAHSLTIHFPRGTNLSCQPGEDYSPWPEFDTYSVIGFARATIALICRCWFPCWDTNTYTSVIFC